MCKQIENTSKRNQTIAREKAQYAYSNRQWTYTDIFQAYNKPSANKVRAWEHCKKLCEELNGNSLIITGRSSHFFSACFKFQDKGRDCYAYITADYNRYCYA